ncbi:flagellar basal-body rod modification protein FlgD [Evansella caseinilytica]|uniref:Flagellar basal-body rod modification protein FlgD n=1 Tax=Evansella caseinilytica TaxID=1503961 RepID=A0A1H3M6P8_9BACI|nr:flagellar hook assembly protein FlgD [Evansella caseinilytica]SDY71974.1 flagellar basal-body rod modification protein FlgD [Evansella caseinilytica]
MSNTVTDSLYYSDYQKAQQQRAASSSLDKDAFLKILITQLQYQDPLNPMEDKEFIAQMAQFSSLEQVTNLNSTMQKFIEQQTEYQLISNSELLGKQVEWNEQVTDEEGNTTIKVMTGIVTAVKFNNGTAELIVDGEYTIAPKNVLKVTQPEESAE